MSALPVHLLVGLLSTAILLYTVLVLGRFLTYWIGAFTAYRDDRAADPGDPADYQWHFVVPCRDEEAVVGRTVELLRRDYPEGRVWIVDDASTDRTGEIVAARAARDPYLNLVSRRLPDARIGKGAALNAAYRAIGRSLPEGADRSRVVVGVIDADGQLDAGVTAALSSAESFGHPGTGAVQIAVRMRNAADRAMFPDRGRLSNLVGRVLVRMQDMEFAVNNAGMQMLRRRTGSVGLGGNGQFMRLSALDDLDQRSGSHGRPWPQRALLEDYESGLELRLAGWRLTHVQEAWVSQEALPDARRFLTQRTRWAQGNMQCLRYLPRILRSPEYTLAGKAETLYTFLQPVTCVLLVLVTPVSAAITVVSWVWFPNQVLAWELHWGWLMLVALLVAVLPLVVWGPFYRRDHVPGTAWWKGVAWGLAMWIYTYHLFPASVRGAWRLARGRNGWAKTRRNAEVVTGRAPVALEA